MVKPLQLNSVILSLIYFVKPIDPEQINALELALGSTKVGDPCSDWMKYYNRVTKYF